MSSLSIGVSTNKPSTIDIKNRDISSIEENKIDEILHEFED